MATNRRVKRDDQWENEADWHRVVAWERLADFASQYLKKGSFVYVEGQIRTRSWEDRDGNKRYTTEIVARDIQALDSKGERSQEETSYEHQPPPPEDDVPF
jgi:single-strand DNA-binding protein